MLLNLDDKRSVVGEHFEKVKKGLEDTKGNLDKLSKEMISVPHADTKGVETVISSANEVFTKLITSVTKLAGITKAGGKIGDTDTSSAPEAASADDVKIVIEGIKEIIETAKESGVKIGKGTEDDKVVDHASGAGATAAVVGKNSAQAVGATAGPKLAEAASKTDPWAMINKIENAKTDVKLTASNDNGVVALATDIATSTSSHNVGAKSTADLAAAVALKAMTKGGEFSAQSSNNESDAVKTAAASAVNKILGVLDIIIRRAVVSNLEKVREAVKKIRYSDNW
ncbi:Variable major protein (plasmid) [Borrelia coriaceae ATCC 43381]|uniref:Variable large protein n=1 Tax=Borrelia coriaceae ATCC 43381 TaxID=1408429 RepID=W5SW19_9SPIR|nr:Variable major protein [Borrelia coriaceae ATCC 43381]